VEEGEKLVSRGTENGERFFAIGRLTGERLVGKVLPPGDDGQLRHALLSARTRAYRPAA
jgi:hypothetical protein